MSRKKAAVLTLQDGTKFTGFSFGAERSVTGEVVFNTAMLGYPELLSDPSNRGLIVAMTYPLIGNYGIPPLDREEGLLLNFESERMQVSGLVVTDYSEEFSHWNAGESLGGWLNRSGVPAVCGIDTRALAQHLREHGAMSGKIAVEGAPESEPEIRNDELGNRELGKGDVTVCVVGENIKNNAVRSLLRRGAKVTTDPAAPWDGMMVTGTPGDPKKAGKVIEVVKKALASGKPLFGVCGGDTILALAAGGDTFKLKHGHRGAGQPVLKAGTDSALITAQNHGYAVVADSLPKDWEVWYTNLNDDTVEGIKHTSEPFRAVAFHPEATNRPVEPDKFYDNFIDAVRIRK